MKTCRYEHQEILSKIHGALALLDPKGTNEVVTQAMAIVYEGFKHYEANLQFSSQDLLKASAIEVAQLA